MSMKMSAEMFKEIVASLKSDGSVNRTTEKRAQGRVGLRCALDVAPCGFTGSNTKAVSVWVRDISVNGIGLVVSARMEEGFEFIARFTRDGQPPLLILYKICYCRRISGDLFSAGAVFERVMPDADGVVAQIDKLSSPGKKKASAAETAKIASMIAMIVGGLGISMAIAVSKSGTNEQSHSSPTILQIG